MAKRNTPTAGAKAISTKPASISETPKAVAAMKEDATIKSTVSRNSPIPRAAAAPASKRDITNEAIQKRAYEIFVSGIGGDELSNWLKAERELKGL